MNINTVNGAWYIQSEVFFLEILTRGNIEFQISNVLVEYSDSSNYEFWADLRKTNKILFPAPQSSAYHILNVILLDIAKEMPVSYSGPERARNVYTTSQSSET